MGSLERDGTWWNKEAAHPRGVKGPAFKHPCAGKHRPEARSAASVSTHLTRLGDKARAHPARVLTSRSHHLADIDPFRACYRVLQGTKAVGVDAVTTAT
jgi:hypothetical protein